MSVTFLDVSGKTLVSTSEPLDFSCTTTPIAISIGFGSVRPEERVYRDGAFLPGYRRSTASAGVFSIVRDQEWPANPQLYVDELPAVAGPQLQPLLGSPFAAWSLINGDISDRSGNGRHLSLAQLPCPDYYAGQTCFSDSASAAVLAGSSTALRLTGALTLTFRYFSSGWGAFTVAGLLAAPPDTFNGANTGYGSWVVHCHNQGGPQLRSSSWGATMPGTIATNGKWYSVCMRRNASGTGFRDWKGLRESSGFTGGGAPAAAGTFYLNGLYGDDSNASRTHGLADVMLWSRMLTDAEVDVQLAGMGIP